MEVRNTFLGNVMARCWSRPPGGQFILGSFVMLDALSRAPSILKERIFAAQAPLKHQYGNLSCTISVVPYLCLGYMMCACTSYNLTWMQALGFKLSMLL